MNFGSGKMAGRKKDPAQTAATRQAIIEKSYELFSTKSIEKVTMAEIARASGFGDMTIYRYFPTKPILVVAAAAWKWGQFYEEVVENETRRGVERMTAAESFELYLDSFLDLYRNHVELLRFSQFFNVYIQSEHIQAETLRPYRSMIDGFRARFHEICRKGERDHTIRTDEPEDQMFSKTLHLMLAVVTRYAVGLVYFPESGFDAEAELRAQKEMLLERYRSKNAE